MGVCPIHIFLLPKYYDSRKINRKHNYCILFGSYSKGKAVESSDVDLLISSDVKGLKFYGMVEKLRTVLHKKVDVLSLEQLKDNLELTGEILKDGIRIFHAL